MTTIMRKSLPTFCICDYDIIVREAYADQTVIDALMSAFGSADRKQIAGIVFSDESSMTTLQSIMQPYIDASLQSYDGSDVIFDIPMFFEMQRDGKYVPNIDASICVTAPLAERMLRVRARDGRTDSQIHSIMRLQIPCDEKVHMCDMIISNDGSITDLILKTRAALTQIGVCCDSRHGNRHV